MDKVELSEESVIVLEEDGEPYWRALVLHPPLQRVDTVGVMQILAQTAYSLSFTKYHYPITYTRREEGLQLWKCNQKN